MALFSTAIELAVFSVPLPVVAADDVVQFVSGCWLGVVDGCANDGPAMNDPAIIAAATR